MTVYNSIEEAVKDTNAAINEIAKLQAENVKLLTAKKELGQIGTGLYAEVEKLEAENAKLNREYIKVWEVLRTYNPSDIELKYIGFEDVK